MTKEELLKKIDFEKSWLYDCGIFGSDIDVAFHAIKNSVIEALEQEPKIRYCKDCKWWKDSDGAFRRGIGAESQCPMNRIEVFEGNGYCYMFKPQESEDKE